MDDIIDDLVRIARRCRRTADVFKAEPIATMTKRVFEVAREVADAWSGSCLGYQANVYTQGLEPRRPGEHFDSMWGERGAYSNTTVGEWAEYDYEVVRGEILRRAGNPDLDTITNAAKDAERIFGDCRSEILPTLEAVQADRKDATLAKLYKEADSLTSHHTAVDFCKAQLPHGKFLSRDMRAIQGGIRPPPHMQLQAWLCEQLSYGEQLKKLAEIASHAAKYLEKKHKMKGRSVAKKQGPIFIGHGRSAAWKELKEFITDRLGLQYEEFNREPTAGLSTKERLLEMLDRCSFAFIVATAEDEHVDGTVHARENVIHEIGMFQGRYSFERAIILLEDGCLEFSNVTGIGQIRFPKGQIKTTWEEIRRVLEREGIVQAG